MNAYATVYGGMNIQAEQIGKTCYGAPRSAETDDREFTFGPPPYEIGVSPAGPHKDV